MKKYCKDCEYFNEEYEENLLGGYLEAYCQYVIKRKKIVIPASYKHPTQIRYKETTLKPKKANKHNDCKHYKEKQLEYSSL